MKKLLTIITSALLCVTMLVLSPAQVAASAADSGKKYISEVKVGMGETSEEASKELLEEGYTILADDKGNYADLNEDAGTGNALKEGPNQKIVYLGYKTTDDASDAITDLAVMNMNGGFSYQEYENLMKTQMDTQIKPFVDRFISTLSEYRENLKKPQDSANYKRANYYRTLLNKLTDDDTGDKPLGDLLVNKTKYEMGDDAYNALSDEEKKEHCDILTLLMQGNGQAIQLMETQLTKASDSSDNTWLDRFLKTDLDKLTQEVKEENPGMTPSEINQEMDKKYYDTAKKIREKWNTFNETLLNYDNALDKAEEAAETNEENKDRKEIDIENVTKKEEIAEFNKGMFDDQATMIKSGMAAEDIVAHDYLEATEYGKGTLLNFFEKDVSEFTSEKKIRDLYPIVDALSDGQIAGLDFLSIKDMILMAISDENGFNSIDVSNMKPASVYQNVNREIYETGGVALTSKALREKAASQQPKSAFQLSKLGIVLWTCTAAAGAVAVGTGVASVIYGKKAAAAAQAFNEAEQRMLAAQAQYDKLFKQSDILAERLNHMFQNEHANPAHQIKAVENEMIAKNKEFLDYSRSPEYKEAVKNYNNLEENQDATAQLAKKSSICKYLSVGFTIAGVILAGYSIYTTITEMMEYYKVDFAPIPKYIVDEADITTTETINGKTETIMLKNQTAYYKVVTCNRTDGGGSKIEKQNHKILLDRADLNGDVGQQWLALYSVKYENGLPILADSLKFKQGKGGAPEGYTTGIHMFGEEAVQNLTDASKSMPLCYNDPNEGTYVFFKRDKAKTAVGSLFSGGSLALGGVIGLAVGGLLTFAVIQLANKKKKKEAEQAQSN